ADKEKPSRFIGTVSASEIWVTLGATIGFAFGMWDDIFAHLSSIIAMLVSRSISSTITSLLISLLNSIVMGGFVGTAIAALNVSNVYEGLGFAPSTFWVVVIHGAIIAVGIGATIRGHLKSRAQRAAEKAAEAQSAEAVKETTIRAHEEAKT